MTTANTYTGKAVKVSGKTLSMVEGFVKRTVQKAVGGSHADDVLDQRRATASMHASSLTSAAFGKGPYMSESPAGSLPSYHEATSQKPHLPPRSGAVTPVDKPPLPPRTPPPPTASRDATPAHMQPMSPPSNQSPTPGQKSKNKARLVASAELIFSTLDQSTKKIIDVGSESISAAVGHKYVFLGLPD
jgi:spartin